MLLFSGLSFGLILELLFFAGILRESIWLSTGYAVLTVLCSVFLAANAFTDPLVGLEAIVCGLVAIVALLYVLDLARYRQINSGGGGGGGGGSRGGGGGAVAL